MFILLLLFLSFSLLLSLLSAPLHATAAPLLYPVANSSFLPLSVGLNLSIARAIEGDGMERRNLTGILQVVGGADYGYFLPILNSPGFDSTANSALSNRSVGFSFGYIFNSAFDTIFLAVCGGLAGSNSTVLNLDRYYKEGFHVNGSSYNVVQAGYVVPLWVANENIPFIDPTASLVVVRGAPPGNGIVLQLRDPTGTVMWSVPDVGTMEMQDTGNLVIYGGSIINGTKVVWQSLSQPRDTLIQGQKLRAGMELRSNDSAYIARMEKGGLVVYLNKFQFIEHPAAYWVLPVLNLSSSAAPPTSKVDLRKWVLELPCEPSYMAILPFWSLTLDLEPGQCTVNTGWTTTILPSYSIDLVGVPFQWLRLEIDGRLYLYGVDSTSGVAGATERHAVDNLGASNFPDVDWGDCAAPMACGPLGVCTPFAASRCECPPSSPEGITLFEFLNSTDSSKGCRRTAPLPKCIRGDEHISTTTYLQMNETSTTFLFGGWPFAFTPSPRVDKCKKLCSANCSCTGFFYQATDFACFFMTDGIGLLHTIDRNESFFKYSTNGRVQARSYTTYLKISSSSPSTNSSGGKHVAIIVASSVMACLMSLGLILYVFHARKEKKKKDKARQAEDEELRDILPLLPSRFSYEDLHKATRGFGKLLGAGGCGSVYAGVLLDGRKVAVKMLEAGMLKGQQSKQFLAEVATVGRTSHHNIVCLVGFCWEVYHRLLVYEYMERGSLDQWLFAKGVVDVADSTQLARLLDWPTRYKVALGIARGLTYLHEDCPQPILHFDIKPQNILLDEAYVAKLADFGLSKLMQRGISEVVTGVRGTPGYIAPEWIAHGAVSKKSDIYSMGMVMLEIVGGRKNIDITLLNSASNEWHFATWAAEQCEQGHMLELVDKRLAQAYDKEQACRLIQAAFWCIHESATKRPSAPTVVQWLEGKCDVKPPPFSSIAHVQSSANVTSSFQITQSSPSPA